MPGEPDLNTLGATTAAAGAAPPATPGEIVEKPYDPTADRETIRGTIALALVRALVCVIAAVVLTGLVTAYACHGGSACNAETMDLKSIRAVIEMVLTPLIGLVGAVTGFYFGEKSASSRPAG